MIKKIISGGQTGADRAALDVALKFNIPHGGWIPKGRKAEDGTLPAKYQLKDMPTASYPARTEKNVLDSDGTVIFSHGKLKGGSKLTLKLANEHQKPCLFIDLNEIPNYNAVFLIRKWMFENDVEILNVAGSRASGDSAIYQKVFDIIKGVYWTDRLKSQNQGSDEQGKIKTVDEAVERILADFPLRDQFEISNFTEEDLAILQAVLAKYIGEKLDGWSVSKELFEDCLKLADGELLDETDATTVILRELWGRLQNTHKLRVVK